MLDAPPTNTTATTTTPTCHSYLLHSRRPFTTGFVKGKYFHDAHYLDVEILEWLQLIAGRGARNKTTAFGGESSCLAGASEWPTLTRSRTVLYLDAQPTRHEDGSVRGPQPQAHTFGPSHPRAADV